MTKRLSKMLSIKEKIELINEFKELENELNIIKKKIRFIEYEFNRIKHRKGIGHIWLENGKI